MKIYFILFIFLLQLLVGLDCCAEVYGSLQGKLRLFLCCPHGSEVVASHDIGDLDWPFGK